MAPPAHAFFGLDDEATERTQVLNNAELLAQTKQDIEQTKAALQNLVKMAGSSTPGTVGQVQRLMAELSRLSGSFQTIYDDPSMVTTHSAEVDYKRRQLDRQQVRLAEMAASAKEIETKMQRTNTAADELSRNNKAAPGALAAQQVGNEVDLLAVDQRREQLRVSTEIWRSTVQQEARRAEDEALAKARDCGFWGEDFTEACEK